MAVFPTNNTARLYLHYTSVGAAHTLQIRVADNLPINVLVAKAVAVGNVFKTAMSTVDSINGLSYSAQGSNLSFPLEWTTIQGTISPSGNYWQEDPESAFYSLVGRDALVGAKVRLFFVTPIKFDNLWPANNRFEPGEVARADTFFDDMTNALEIGGAAGGGALTVARATPVWNAYVNVAKNAYIQRKQRRALS